jgi:regulator of protease activity HflC (stomatin/prohibitin superfamily)
MRKLLLVLILAGMGCSSVRPEPGTEEVIIRRPMFFGSGGIDPTPLTSATGRKYIAWTTDHVPVNVQPQSIEVEFDDLMTRDGVPLDFHATIQVQINDSVRMIRDFGFNWFKNNIEQPFRTAVRESVKQHGLNEMAIDATAADEVDAAVTAATTAIIAELKVPIILRQVTLGRANPPDAIKHQRVETAEQEQRIKTEQQRKLAEDQRMMAEQSRAAADAAYNLKMDLSPAQYLQLETIKMQRDVCSKGGCYFGFPPAFTQAIK